MKPIKAPPGAQHAGTIERTDAALATAAARYRKHPVVRTLGTVAEIADQPPLISLCVGTIAAGALLRRPRLLRAGLRMLASEMVATGAKAVVKRYVNRTRPNKAIEDGRYALHADLKGSKDEGPWNSFPSGHTAGAVSVGRAFVREYPGAAPAVGLAVAFVAAIQPFIGAHYPSDVAAGAVVGLGSEALVDAVAGVRL
ncbi:phosphatase PAP2 family protein [Sphingomonas sp. M1-B02]|uniref:phosphatase PAP2 family protein n=1 Tax=Sphingomonas sp. M1-B02 TaxID=3114300 RepID=UPI002240673E|nr:phosphatase PAP2 family protein [Sphingomonas sp. S6-11]UZK64798.1 phosphatase PAP2 family protein [Sphingomonas sp. S6-11]